MTSPDDRDSDNTPSPAKRHRSAGSVFGLFVLMLIFGAVAGVCYVHWLHPKSPPVYEAESYILLINRQSQTPSPLGATPTTDPVTHGYLIRSDVVVQMAMEKSRLKDLSSLKDVPRQDIPKTIIANLTAGKVGGPETSHDSDIIQLRYRSPNAADAVTVLNALIEAHSDYVGQAWKSSDGEIIRQMSQAKDSLDTELREKMDQERTLVKNAPAGTVGKPDDPGRAEQTLRGIDETRRKLELRRAHLAAVLAAASDPFNSEESLRGAQLLLAPYLKPDGERTTSLIEPYLKLIAEKDRLSAELGRDHVKTKEAELKIAIAKELLDNGFGAGAANVNAQSEDGPKEFVAAALAKIRLDLSIVEKEIADLTQQAARTEEAVQNEEGFRVNYTGLQAEITNLKELNQLVMDRLKQIDLMRNSGGFRTQVISPPNAAVPVEPNRMPLNIIAAAIGAVAGCALAALLLVLRVA